MSDIAKQLKEMGAAYRGSDFDVAPERLARIDATVTRAILKIEAMPVSRWTRAVRTISAIRSLPHLLPNPARLAIRPVGIMASVVFFAFAGWITAISAFTSILPGDRLYDLKLASERTQLSLTFNSDSKTELQLEFAGRRLNEVTRLAESSLPDQQERLNEAVEQFKNQIHSAQSKLQTAPNRKKVTSDIAKIVDRKASEYQKVLSQTSGFGSLGTQEKVIEARDAAQAASFAAVTALLEQQRTGQFSTDETRQRIGEKLRELEGGIQLVALRLTSISGNDYPEVTTVGGPTVQALIADLGQARESLESAKNFFVQGGFEAALNNYRIGIGYLNQLQWGIGLYEQAQAVREQSALQPSEPEAIEEDVTLPEENITNGQQP